MNIWKGYQKLAVTRQLYNFSHEVEHTTLFILLQ